MEKVCVNHPESPAVGSCRACEKPVCLMCVHEVHGVSFCSDACGTAYKEVKDWLERPAADEEWNPLAEAKKAPAPARPKPVTSVPPPRPATSVPVPARKPTPPRNPSPPELREAPDTPTPAASPSASNRLPLYLGLAAAALVAIGLFFMFKGSSETATEPIARTLPPAGEPPKADPSAGAKEPRAKAEPPKPEPVKPPPPKPEPVKPDPSPGAKETGAKAEPPKPEPPKPEPPKPEPVKVEPPKSPPVHLAFIRDPWGKEKAGSWYRVKITAQGQDSYRDVGLRESGAGYRVLVSQECSGGKVQPESFVWTEPEEASVFGSINGDVQGTKYAADVVRTKPTRPSVCVFKEGPHAGVVFPSDATLKRLDLQTVRVKDRDFPCSVLETEQKEPARVSRIWFSPLVPIGSVRAEVDGTQSSLVDFGDDWAARPPFPGVTPAPIAKVEPPPPPPRPEPAKPEPVKPQPVKPEPAKPPPPAEAKDPEAKVEPVKPPPPPPPPPREDAAARVKKSLAEAAVLIREATPLYQEISGAMDSPPEDRKLVRDLFAKAERLRVKLADARILYTSVKADAPDPAMVVRRIGQLDDLLDAVQECMKTLKKRLE